MLRILVATTNIGKLRELYPIIHAQSGGTLAPLGLRDVPAVPEAVEDRPTFVGNAMAKALHYANRTGLLTLADDSGLCVDALDGRPGVHSARYAGLESNDAANNAKLVAELKEAPGKNRTARFVCAMALATPDAVIAVMEESMEGEMILEPRGKNGFGYDPYFFLPAFGCTNAELLLEQKSAISHRGKAALKMVAWMAANHGRLAGIAEPNANGAGSVTHVGR